MIRPCPAHLCQTHDGHPNGVLHSAPMGTLSDQCPELIELCWLQAQACHSKEATGSQCSLGGIVRDGSALLDELDFGPSCPGPCHALVLGRALARQSSWHPTPLVSRAGAWARCVLIASSSSTPPISPALRSRLWTGGSPSQSRASPAHRSLLQPSRCYS